MPLDGVLTETEDEIAAVAEARAAIARGEIISDEDLAHELGQ